jgi:hypothetical protein
MIGFLFSRVGRWLALAGAAFVTGLTLALKWASLRRKADEGDRAKAGLKTVKDVNDATSKITDADNARKYLADRMRGRSKR